MNASKLLPRGTEAGAPVTLPDLGPFTIGRELDNDLPLHHPATSREHAVLEGGDGRWTLRDAGSGNGTFVDGRRIRKCRLRGGEVLRFGPDVEYRFVVDRPLPFVRRLVLSFFRSSLVPRDERLPRVSVGAASVIVGRSDKADLHLNFNQISDVHARLETRGGRPWITDHRSKNGTYVNGDPVKERILRPGDEVAFADLVYDVAGTARPNARGIVAGSVAALSVAAVFVGSGLQQPDEDAIERLWTRDMYVAQAEESLSDALAAYDLRPPNVEVAKARFDIAVRSLIASDRLRPDRRTDEEIAAEFRKASRSIRDRLGGRDLFRIYTSLEEKETRREEIPTESLVERELSLILGEFGIDTREQPIPPALLEEVDRFVDFWTTEMRGYTTRAMGRADPHLDMIQQQFRDNLLPEVFSYLPFVESGYRPDISSPAGARGMWQFMPATGRKYGLVVTDDVDQRIEPDLATQAACRYINDLLTTFGANAFMAAVAAYNKGEYGMVTCLRGVSWKSKWKFWDMVEKRDGCLKQETIEYVPKFLAAAIVMRRPDLFGLEGEAPRS